MKLFNTRRRKVLGTIATCAVAGVATLAIAAWLVDSPPGSGGGKYDSLETPEAPIAAFNGGDCAPPANSTCELRFTIDTNNNAPMKLTAVVAPDGTPGDGGGSSNTPGCLASTLNLN